MALATTRRARLCRDLPQMTSLLRPETPLKVWFSHALTMVSQLHQGCEVCYVFAMNTGQTFSSIPSYHATHDDIIMAIVVQADKTRTSLAIYSIEKESIQVFL